MTSALVLFCYVGLCLLSGYCGYRTRLGFWGCVVFAALLTPVIVLPVLFLLQTVSRPDGSA